MKVPRSVMVFFAAALAFAIGLAMWGHAEHRAYIKALGASAVLTAEYRDYKAQSEPIIKNLQTEAVALRADKNAAIDRALAAESSKDKAIAERDAALASVAAMPADTLSGSINLRIGAGRSWPTAGGLFSFTRPGAESVLSLFIRGEADAKLYTAERSVTANLRTALTASERESGNLGQRLTLTEGELDRAIAAWAAETDALSHLRRSIIGRTVKTAAISFGAGALTVFALRAVGVIK